MNSLKKPSYLENVEPGRNAERILLCAHGLNQKPQALKRILVDIGGMGFKTYLLHMPGHSGESDFRHLTAETYIEAFQKAYDFLVQENGQEIYFLGYSFGGLIGVHHFDICPFKKMVLLAPALKLHGYTSLLKPFLPYISRVRSVGFGNPEMEARYRYHDRGVPPQVYSSFFTIYSRNKFKDKSLVKKSQALVMMHPRDELVSYWKLKRWVSKKTNWQFNTLSNKEAEFKQYNHLCFDPVTLGEQAYTKLLADIQTFMNLD